ncbi:MAG TPA: glycosyltransferase family 87 protein [Terriglobales bacterium]|nr:glycosyltransferase family 87 protein [Terriglobales bacterium]
MRPRPKATLFLTILLAVGTCYYYFGLLLPQLRRQDQANGIATHYGYGGDFYPIWLTGRALLMHRSDPYTREMTRNIQTGLYGRPMDANRPLDHPVDYHAFAYPLYADLLAAPMLPFSFDTVRILLSLLLAPLTAASVILWLRVLGLRVQPSALATLIILTLANYPVLEGLYQQQLALLVGVALAASLALLVQNRLLVSGIFLAFASVKPQMVWLVAIFMLVWCSGDWKRRKTMALSFLLTIALLGLSSQVALPGWFSGWRHVLAGYSAYTLPPLPQLVLGRLFGSAVALGAFALAVAIGWKARRALPGSQKFLVALSFTLAVTPLLLSSAGAAFDQVVMLPGIFWLWSRREEILNASRPVRVLMLAAIVALSWQWVAGCAVALLSLAFPEWARTSAVLFLPMRMEASLPFAVIALLSLLALRLVRGRTINVETALADSNPV